MYKKHVCVIGAGISGLTTATLLLENGYKVSIFSADPPNIQNDKPAYASSFPAASVIPHSVYSDKSLSLLSISQRFFQKLWNQRFPGIFKNQHYELFGFEKKTPDYAGLMNNYQELSEFKSEWFPKHPDVNAVSGWKFEYYFADWPLYFPALLNRFFELGGELEIIKFNKRDVRDLPFQHIINCSGLGSVSLFNDPEDLIYRGHLLLLKNMPSLNSPKGNKTVSYNITPEPGFISKSSRTIDLYCYPRKDGWVFGGSRQLGKLDEHGNWQSMDLEVSDHGFPSYIFEMNREIIKNSFGVEIHNPETEQKIGYRYFRKMENGLQLYSEEAENKLIIHNYGHGGAGVTLSWGCAQKVLEILESS